MKLKTISIFALALLVVFACQTEAKSKNIKVKSEWKVSGSKGNVYKVVNDDGFWSCSCPAHGFGRGRDCKHIVELKTKQNGKAASNKKH